ncbi:Hsp20/alpha crystallin family protein [Haloferula sp. A504]|uniref:Hsp20/alpha crystallin family protein n=1 Tax=Haloferula sp. A504 TaxID=3373601 RepID=UPI0031C26CEF|nr:Hsp20/alpha crystallin family protein [Verrucomicrobiaceae bacterium E54]
MILAQHLRNTSPWLSDFGRLFDAALRGVVTTPADLRVHEDDDGWSLEVDFPGVSRDELDLELKEKALHLRVKDDTRYRLPLGDKVDVGAVAARFEDGVLAIRLPKADATRDTHRIEIH